MHKKIICKINRKKDKMYHLSCMHTCHFNWAAQSGDTIKNYCQETCFWHMKRYASILGFWGHFYLLTLVNCKFTLVIGEIFTAKASNKKMTPKPVNPLKKHFHFHRAIWNYLNVESFRLKQLRQKANAVLYM